MFYPCSNALTQKRACFVYKARAKGGPLDKGTKKFVQIHLVPVRSDQYKLKNLSKILHQKGKRKAVFYRTKIRAKREGGAR